MSVDQHERAAGVAPPRVCMVYGFWGQNIGNAFFNVGGRWVLEQAFGAGSVRMVQDQPGYRTFHDQSRGNPPGHLDLIARVDCDLLVLQGPMLTSTFRQLWEPTFRALRERGVGVLLLGAGFFRYTDEEVASAGRFLAELPPRAIVTRDSRTYAAVKDWAPHTFDGLDSAFFVSDAYEPVALDGDPYVCFTFDRYLEPTLVGPGAAAGRADAVIDTGELSFGVRRSRLDAISRRGKAVAYGAHLLDRRRLPTSVAGRTIVRPEHRSNPFVGWKVGKAPGAVVSDEPFTYLTLYRHCELTLSDRVHACVATLAYGNPAMLFSPTPRGALFERVGAGAIRERVVRVDPDDLAAWKAEELAFLRACAPELVA